MENLTDKEKLAIAMEVVKFYADSSNWRLTPEGRVKIRNNDKSLVDGKLHGGKKAREVLRMK